MIGQNNITKSLNKIQTNLIEKKKQSVGKMNPSWGRRIQARWIYLKQKLWRIQRSQKAHRTASLLFINLEACERMFHATHYVTNYIPIFLSNYKTTNLGHRAHKWRLPHDYLRQLGNECFTKYLVQDKPNQCNSKSKSMKSKNRGHRSQHLSLLGVSSMHRKTYRSQHLVTQNGNCERTRSHSS